MAKTGGRRKKEGREAFVAEEARDYERKRIGNPPWELENKAVADMLAGTTGRVLDLPIGTGRFLKLFADLRLSVVGVDWSPDMMVQAAKLAGPDVDLIQGDAFAMDWGRLGKFDAAVCLRFFEHCTRNEALTLVGKFVDVLKPGGILIASHSVSRMNRETTLHPYLKKRMVQVYRDVGLKIEDEMPLMKGPRSWRFMWKARKNA